MRKQNLINYVVNSHVRNELDINELLRLIHLLPDEPELNSDQQIVLEWLKEYTLDDSDFRNAIFELNKLYSAGFSYKKEEIAFKKLNDIELAQVLAAFAEWGMKEVGEV